MAFEHPSGLPATYDRAASAPARSRMVWPEDVFIQGADLNELQSLETRRNRRVGNMVAKDGDRISGAEAIVDVEAGTVTLGAGRVYISGDVREIAAAILSGVPMTGEVTVGVRLLATTTTHEEDPTLLGLHPGTWAEGEPGAARIQESIAWAIEGDDQEGVYFSVYLLRDGTIIDQSPPPSLTGVNQQIARYDHDAHGHYIVDGCDVVAIGKVGGDQIFSIQAGTANILGFKRIREAALRHSETEAPDLESIAAEPHTFTGTTGGTATIPVSRAPIGSVTAVVMVKRVTQVVTRGGVPGGLDALANASVVEIESVVQGGTTYVATTDYVLAGGSVSWAPAGAEPAGASTYSVTYLYNASVIPDAVTSTGVTVTGGVNGRAVYISYNSKLPRIDLMCLDQAGRPVYVKGLSGRNISLAPIAPILLLKLAEVHNDWLGTPTIVNNGVRNYTFAAQRRLFNRLIDILDQFDRSEAQRDILAREPVAKKGIFTDTFVDDFYRDQGAAQTAACNRGVLELAIDDILNLRLGTAPITLDYTEEVIIRQEKATSIRKINPYANFEPMPASITIEPGVDYWTEEDVDWTSPVTMEFHAAPNQPPGQSIIQEVTDIRRQAARFLRQISVTAKIRGFGGGENLATLTFDGINVKPGGTQTANGSGSLDVTFTVPANVPIGTRVVRATGAAGSFAETIFVGEGTVDIYTMRRVTLVTLTPPTPPPPPEVEFDWGWTASGDPLSESFALPEGRHIIGIDLKIGAIGNPDNAIRVQLRSMVNGYPGPDVFADVLVDMHGREVGDIVQPRFRGPVFCSSDREHCFVVLTDDDTHALAMARLGDVDPETQQRVSAQPYTVGVMFDGSNNRTWTAIQDGDLWFRVVAAKFSPATKTVNLWTGAFTNISDVLVRGTVELPDARTRFRYELVRATGQIIPLAPGQDVAFPEFVTETVTLRAVLQGDEKVSPLLYPGTLLAAGRIRTTGTYISRLFDMGSAVKVAALFASMIPAGATVSVDCDSGNGSWQALSAVSSGTLGGGWSEPKYEKASFTAATGRIRLTLNGGPGARVQAARLRAYSV